MDTNTGRFISQDSYAGSVYDPVSLHKYLYANSNPVMYSDPSGYFSLGSVVCASTIGNMLFYSASSCMIALGMNLVRQLNDIRNGMQECINWGDAIADAVIALLTGATFSGLGLGLLPKINSAFVQAIICCAFGTLGVGSFILNLSAARCDYRTKEPDLQKLAFVELLLAGWSAYGSVNCFKSAANLFKASATASSTTNPSTDNTNTASSQNSSSKVYRTSNNEYTNGNYKMSSKGNSDHTSNITYQEPGETLPKSRFMFGVDNVQVTFDAAEFADANNLWVDNKAHIYVTDGYVGVTGSGEPTQYITVTRTDSNYIHAWPSNPPH